ncbi:MAG: glycerol-3-phosphate 1-O-acyltransferase PlsY [Verrucomicrobia bacterium]|jgi:glycerol-3-phosphate acyltransferase PlsY|nr:glycerol-3-phosphate 1-O-acyltransferase PlsY [Verrucomicrobiota bacterium]
MDPLSILAVVVAGYLIGAISFAVIIARSRGVDIFTVGSGNPGATNVKRAFGKKWGNLTFALDALKGFVAAGWPLLAYGGDDRLAVIGLIAAILGHSFSVFLRFRGGKGVATAIGGLLALMWPVLLIGLAVWLITFFSSRVVALASILFALSLPVSTYFFYYTENPKDPRFYLGIVLAVFIVIRHRSNIARMFSGKENRF